jgi:hypothetical protein
VLSHQLPARLVGLPRVLVRASSASPREKRDPRVREWLVSLYKNAWLALLTPLAHAPPNKGCATSQSDAMSLPDASPFRLDGKCAVVTGGTKGLG